MLFLQTAYQTASAEKQHFEGLLSLTKNEMSAVRTNLDKLVDEKITEEKTAMSEQHAALEAEKLNFETKSAEIEKQNEILEDENKTLENQLQEFMNLKEQLEEMNIEKESLSTKVNELETELRTSVIESARVEMQKDEISAAFTEQNEQLSVLNELREGLAAATELNQSLQLNVTESSKAIEDYEVQQKQLTEKVEGLEWKVQEGAELESELEMTQQRLFEVQSENGAFKRALQEKEGLNKNLDEKLMNLMAEKNDLKKQLEDAISQVSSMFNKVVQSYSYIDLFVGLDSQVIY